MGTLGRYRICSISYFNSIHVDASLEAARWLGAIIENQSEEMKSADSVGAFLMTEVRDL